MVKLGSPEPLDEVTIHTRSANRSLFSMMTRPTRVSNLNPQHLLTPYEAHILSGDLLVS